MSTTTTEAKLSDVLHENLAGIHTEKQEEQVHPLIEANMKEKKCPEKTKP